MKPAWDKLAKKFAKSKDVVIADCDCTAAGQSLCQQVGVKGYPTIKYFLQGKQNDYQGGRDYDSLHKHVVDNMGPPPPPCDIMQLEDTCGKRETKFLNEVGSADAAVKKLEELEDLLKSKQKKGKKKFIGKAWLVKRIGLLKQVEAHPEFYDGGKEEL